MFNIPYEHIEYSRNVLEKGLKKGKIDPDEVIQLIQQNLSDAIIEIQNRYGLTTDGALEYVRMCCKARGDSKSIGFGLNYGMGAGKLSRQINAPLKEAQEKIRIYKETYPAVDSFFKEAVEEGKKYGYSFTVLGRRRNIPMISSHRKEEQALGERLAVNTQIQGSAADVVKMAQLNIDAMCLDQKYNCHMLLQIHDELVFEAPTEVVPEVQPMIVELMSHPFCVELSCPLTAEAGNGKSWGQAK
jgi:DNA polymerase-1